MGILQKHTTFDGISTSIKQIKDLSRPYIDLYANEGRIWVVDGDIGFDPSISAYFQ